MFQIAVILTDAKRRILWVNEDFTVITGYTYDEAIGRIPGDILQGPRSEQEAIEQIRAGLRDLVAVKANITNYRKNGVVLRQFSLDNKKEIVYVVPRPT